MSLKNKISLGFVPCHAKCIIEPLPTHLPGYVICHCLLSTQSEIFAETSSFDKKKPKWMKASAVKDIRS